MKSLRSLGKDAAERLLGSERLLRARLRGFRGARLVLAYHNVVAAANPPTLGDRSLHLPLRQFREQLDALSAAGLRVVSLDATMHADGAPSVAITFDDAYAGALELALPELARRGMPATVFVAPGLLGVDAPWWDRLADPHTGAVPDRLREVALASLRGEGTRVLAAAAAQAWPIHPAQPEHRIASEAELQDTMVASPLLTLGAHTWSHPNLAALDSDVLQQELASARTWLRGRFADRVLDQLAYPYGLESAGARDAAAAAGYAKAYRVTGGWDRGDAPVLALPRLNVTPGLSLAGFRARLAGFLS